MYADPYTWHFWLTLALPACDVLLLLRWLVTRDQGGAPVASAPPARPWQIWLQDGLITSIAYGAMLAWTREFAASLCVGLGLLAALDFFRRTTLTFTAGARAIVLIGALFFAAVSPILIGVAWYVWNRTRDGWGLPPAPAGRAEPLRGAALFVMVIYAIAFVLPFEFWKRTVMWGYECYAYALKELLSRFDEERIALSWLANPILWLSVQQLLRGNWRLSGWMGAAAAVLAGQLLLFDGFSPAYHTWLLSMIVAAVLPFVIREKRSRNP